jgi:tryptophanyl-tRNA synthetase
LYPNVLRVQKNVNYNQIKGVFGFNDSDNIGKFAYPPVQAVPSFCNTFPHIFGTRKNVRSLIPCAIDQDPYFRMTRDVAAKLKYLKTASFYSTFFPALQGLKCKMSSSDPNTSILLTDKPDQIKKKINSFAFSGGGRTLEEHKANGANLDIDVPYQYLRFFFDDDAKLAEIEEKYGKGEMLTAEVKEILIKCL